MSYDVVILVPPIAESDAKAWEDLDGMISNVGPLSSVLRKFFHRLVDRFPCPSSLSDDEIDNCVWQSGPVVHNFGKRSAVLAMSYTRCNEVFPLLLAYCRELDLNLFDLNTGLIYRPDGLQRLKLQVEDRVDLEAPTLNQLCFTVDDLTPDGGPGFMAVESADGSYTQAAGGNGVYVCEWRECSPHGTFRHWVAGIAGQISDAEVQVPTNGFQVTVKTHEQLPAAYVKRILAAFYHDSIRPPEFAWCEITDRFL